MENTGILSDNENLKKLCGVVRDLLENCRYRESERMIVEAIGRYPHAPEPHNLMGILLERKHDHIQAMKHFRAAWALDPAYIPARYNMEQYGDVFGIGRKDAFDDSDCPQEEEKKLYKIEYDSNGIGHTVKREKNDGLRFRKY